MSPLPPGVREATNSMLSDPLSGGPHGLTLFSVDYVGSPLSQAVRLGALPPGWMTPVPMGVSAWRDAAETVAREFRGGAWIDDLREAIQPRGPAGRRLEDVAKRGGILVTTGQQPGLFGGPLLTLVKALSARGLADVLERETGIPAAPLFWAATDDADFDEASVVAVATDEGVVSLRSPNRPPPGTPMSDAPLGDVRALMELLRSACGSTVDPLPLEVLERAYAPAATIGGAYVDLLRALFEPLEISVLDASHASVRRAGAKVMRRALEQAGPIAAAVHDRIVAIRAAGMEPQVDEVPGLSLVFAYEEGTKRRLTVAESEAAARSIPAESLSPTVLLRPVLERAILPTVAYTAGPGELAYFAQVAPIAELLGVAPPRAVARWTTTIYEPRIKDILMQKLESTPLEIRDPERVAQRLARERMPEGVRAALQALREQIDAGIEALRLSDDTALLSERARGGLRANLLYRLERGERRILAAVKRRDAEVGRDIRIAHDALFPGGVPQERALSWVPFLVRYGGPLSERLLGDARRHAGRLLGIPEDLASPHRSPAAE